MNRLRSVAVFVGTLGLLGLSALPACVLVARGGEASGVEFEASGRRIPPGLTLSPPLRCDNNDELRAEGLYIIGDGPGILATGNCDIWIVGSTIDVRGVALRVDGNGDVYLRDSTLHGTDAAVVLNGNGDLHANNSVMIGKRELVGNGDFVDEGKNTLQ